MKNFQDGVIEEGISGGVYVRIYQTGGVQIFADQMDSYREVWLDQYAWKALKELMEHAENLRKQAQ